MWFLAFAPYDNPKIALAVLVQGAQAGGQVPAPIAAKLIEEILALDKGFDPGVKPLDPAIGNFKFVQTINFKDTGVPAQFAANDEETADTHPVAEETTKSSSRSKPSEPDIRPEADNHSSTVSKTAQQQEKHKSFFDFFRRKPKEDNSGQQQQPQQTEKKKRFLFF
jgi:penicillin-binding protein 2